MTLSIPQPSEKQLLMLNDTHRYIGYGGARGGGKSWAVRTKAVLLCLKWPGIKVMIVRKTYPELQENHIIPLTELLRCGDQDETRRIAKYSDTKKHIVFPNSSRILFRYCDTDSDADHFQGTEVDVLFIDEATQQSEERARKLTACVRGVNNFPKRVYCTMNPGGEGHDWVKRLFIDRIYKEGENPEDYSFIQSLATDNTALIKSDPEYIKRLQALPEKLRKAWLEGRWDVFDGQFFEDFSPLNHVIEPFDLNRGECAGWTVFRSYDFGYSKPFSCAWWAVDYDGVLYRILELYGCTDTPNEGLRWTPRRQFEEIARIEREHPWLTGRSITGVADPSIFDSSRGESIADMAAECGIFFDRGDNNRIAGWMQCHYRLSADENGKSGMYVFSNCRAFIRTIPLMTYSKTIPEDLNTNLEDHVADEWRYACMSRPIKPSYAPTPGTLYINPLQ